MINNYSYIGMVNSLKKQTSCFSSSPEIEHDASVVVVNIMTNQDFHRYLLLWGWFFAVITMEGEVETESESLERLSLLDI